MHAHAIPEVHALAVDQAKQVEARRQRAAPVPGGDCRVRGRAPERESELGGRQRGVREHVAIVRVVHHRGVHALEHAKAKGGSAFTVLNPQGKVIIRSPQRRTAPR